MLDNNQQLKKFLALSGISLASFLTAIDFAIVNTALPTIQYDLRASLTQLQWVMNIYVLLICASMVTMGRFGDLFGRKKMLIFGIIIFALASLFAGLTTNLIILITCRALQGIGSATIIPCSLSLITDIFPADERAKAIGIWSGINGIGFAIGPVLGGLLVSWLNWPWVFFIVIPFAIISLIICTISLNKTSTLASNIKIDWSGFLLLSLGIAALVIAVIQGPSWRWESSLTIGAFAISILCLVTLYFVEKKVEFPIIEFHLFANRQFFAGAIANFAVVTFAYAGFFLMPLYLQNMRNEEAYVVGLMLLPITAAMTIISPITGQLVNRIGEKNTVSLGLVILTLGILMQCYFQTIMNLWYITTAFILFGVAWGIIWGSATNLAISALPENASGLASGALWTQQNVGGAVGLAIAGTLFRVLEQNTLFQHLNTHRILLTDDQLTLIRSILSNPESANTVLNQLATAYPNNLILHFFQEAFMQGYHGAMWFLFAITLCSLIVARMALRGYRSKPSSQHSVTHM